MVTALILSGGTGTRLGEGVPKQYRMVGKKPIFLYGLETIANHEKVDAIQIVAASEWQETILEWLRTFQLKTKFRGFSLPGETRQLSIYRGIKDIQMYAPEDSVVLIHDAARPMVSKELISGCIEKMQGADGVLPILPMKDTVYLSEDEKQVSSLLPRSKVFAGQAPEVFLLGKYREANEQLITFAIEKDGTKRILPSSKIYEINGSTEPAILSGMNIATIPGEEENFKITTKDDLDRFTQIVKGREES